MPSIGIGCYERRINDAATTWRVVYRADPGAVVIAEVFNKKTQRAAQSVVVNCQRRLKEHDNA